MRPDGKHVKDVDPMYTLAPYFMRTRNDAQNMITVKIPYENIHKYVLGLRKRGIRVSHMAVVISAYIRMICDYPCFNRFVVNSKIFARKTFSVGMVVLRPDEADPSMSKMNFDLESTIFEVNDTINNYVEENNKADSENKSDKLFKTLVSFPPLVRILMALFRGLDRFGLLPNKIIELSPFHNSMVFTNLASIRTNHIYHHVYNFGTTSLIMAMGNMEDVPVKEKGEIVMKRMIPLGIVMDERIASGCVYAKGFERLQHLLKYPEELEKKPENITVDFPFPTLSKRFEKKK